MNEEEMKNQIEYIIEVVTQGDEYTLRYYDIQCIMRLLDLYQQEKKEKESIYNDYQDLGKENLKLQKELEQEKEKSENLSFLLNCYTNEYFIEKSAVEKEYISKDKIRKIQGELYMELGSYVRNEGTPEQERIAGGINIINKILKSR